MDLGSPVSIDGIIIACVGLVMPFVIYWKAKHDAAKMVSGMKGDILIVAEKITKDMALSINAMLDSTKQDAIDILNELKKDLADAPEILGKVFATTLSKSIGGMISGDTRLDKGLATRVMADVVNSQDPLVQMVLGQAKNTLPFLNEHPELMPQVIGMIQKFLPNLKLGGNSTQKPQEQKLGL